MPWQRMPSVLSPATTFWSTAFSEYDYDLTEEGELAKIRLQNAWTRAQEEAER